MTLFCPTFVIGLIERRAEICSGSLTTGMESHAPDAHLCLRAAQPMDPLRIRQPYPGGDQGSAGGLAMAEPAARPPGSSSPDPLRSLPIVLKGKWLDSPE